MMTREQKTELIHKYSTGSTDTGSPEVQVALLTRRIEELNKHFGSHKKDHSSRHGLLQLVGRRRKLLAYLKKTSAERYQKLINALDLRK